jgi:hypothetical protein
MNIYGIVEAIMRIWQVMEFSKVFIEYEIPRNSIEFFLVIRKICLGLPESLRKEFVNRCIREDYIKDAIRICG